LSKVILKGCIAVPPNDLDAVSFELDKHIELTLGEVGCLVFTVTQDKNNKFHFNVYEEFVDKKAFELHQERVKNSKWASVTKNSQRFYTVTC
jgi:quinol monooxygenase YgiN